MKPFDAIESTNPFLTPSKQTSWWLRDSTPTELQTHRRLTDKLTKLENQWTKVDEPIA